MGFALLEGLQPTFGSKVFGGLCSGNEVHGLFEGLCSNFLPKVFGSAYLRYESLISLKAYVLCFFQS